MMSLAACVTGFFLDRLFGDPVWLYHPVRMIGNMISFLEKRLRKENDKKNMTAGGIAFFYMRPTVHTFLYHFLSPRFLRCSEKRFYQRFGSFSFCELSQSLFFL